jgi:hypothetical protein
MMAEGFISKWANGIKENLIGKIASFVPFVAPYITGAFIGAAKPDWSYAQNPAENPKQTEMTLTQSPNPAQIQQQANLLMQQFGWNNAERQFSQKYLFIPIYNSRVAYQEVLGQTFLQPLYEYYDDYYLLCKRVTQDGTFQQIQPALNPEFLRDRDKVKNSRPNFNSKVFENQMMQVTSIILPIVLPIENGKIKYLDPKGQPNEYIDRGIITIADAQYNTWNRMRIDQKSQMHPMSAKEAETSEYNLRYGDVRMMIKQIEEYANGRPFFIMLGSCMISKAPEILGFPLNL